ncbi:Topoisomerase 1-associated factor 1 [Tilletia horrida]|uniref:Topoisomerase 1-associated factor 1 n=1 Tax=Tilletia horrida TaxID=155126 RepID=A0AAN6JJ03_9BASI|nr:Topoisomerase 1-associated factor 1 [Tilletia horrida]
MRLQYKKLHRLGREYPDPNYRFLDKLRSASRRNASLTDDAEIQKTFSLGEFIAKEIETMAELDYVDDLDLLEEYDLAEGASDFSSSEEQGRGRVNAEDDELPSDYDEEEENKALMNIVIGLCSALGGPEEVIHQDGSKETVYRPGDDCLADLITALTWPMDVLGELHEAMEKELDETKISGLPALQRAQVNYKASIMRVRGGPSGTADRDFLSTVMNFVLLPSLTKPRPNRTERDVGTINMCLHLFRNLLAIKDPIATSLDSTELVELSTLQSKLVLALHKSKILETLLMLSSSASRRDFEDWNAITAECIYHLIVGTSPKALLNGDVEKPHSAEGGDAEEAKVVPAPQLSDRNKAALLTSLLTEASQKRANVIASASSRHSRFGTTISFMASDGHRGVARQASSLRKSVEELEAEEKARTRRRKPTRRVFNEKGAPRYRPDWSKAAARVVIRWSDDFVKHGLVNLSKTLIEDLRRERDKLGDLDVARIHFMQMASYFLEYFMLRRAASPNTKLWDPNNPEAHTSDKSLIEANAEGKQADDFATQAQAKDRATTESAEEGAEKVTGQEHLENQKQGDKTIEGQDDEIKKGTSEDWPLSTVDFFTDKWPFVLVNRRVKDALTDRNWLELMACTQLWITMLKLMEVEELSIDEAERENAEYVQATIHEDNDVHETAKAITVCYKRQTFAFLETLIQFAYAYPRSLERFMKGRESMMVRAKVKVRKQMRKNGEQEGDEEEVEKRAKDSIEDAYKERAFTFNAFQDKLSSRFLADTCLDYIMRWREFTNPKEQLDTVVRVMHRIAIKGNGRRMFYQAHQRAGFKKLQTEMTVLEAVAPKPAENLKQLIRVVQRSWDKLTPEEKEKFAEGKRAPRQLKTVGPPRDIEVKEGHSVEEKIGIAVGLLLEKELMPYVNWVKGALEHASAQRKEIILNTDGMDALDKDEDGDVRRPSMTAMDKFEAHVLPFEEGDNQLRKDAATLPPLKLLCRLLGLDSHSISEEECTWSVPAATLPEHLDADIATIEKYIRSPVDTNGESFSTFVQNVRKPRERKLQEPRPMENMEGFIASDSSSSGNESSDGDFQEGQRKKKRVFSEDELSDADDSDDEGINKHQRALQRLKAREERRKQRKEQKQAAKEEKAKQRKLKKKVYRPGDDGRSKSSSGRRARRLKLAVAPMFAGLEAALDDRIEDSDEEMADFDRAIAQQQAEMGINGEDAGNQGQTSSSPASQRGDRLSSSPSPFGAQGLSSPPTSPARDPQSPLFRGMSPAPVTKSPLAARRLQTQSPAGSASPTPARRATRVFLQARSPISRKTTAVKARQQLDSDADSEVDELSPAKPTRAPNALLSSPFASPLSRAVASSRSKEAAAAPSPASSPMSRIMGSSHLQLPKRANAAIASSSPPRSSPPPASSSGSDAIMSRWKAFASKSIGQEPKSLFIFSDNEDDEMDELADEEHPAAGAASSSAFRLASQQRSKSKSKAGAGASKPKKSRTSLSSQAARVPLAERNQLDEEDELVDELEGDLPRPVAPVGTKAKGMQGRTGAPASSRIGASAFGVVVDVGDKRKRAILSEDDDDI